jgi:Tol biopolymer transport system component/tRNA A-37 threonylcarbamoyl transferase component Bud32
VKGHLQGDVLMTDAKRRGRKKQGDEETAPMAQLPGSLKGPGSRIGQFEIEREIGRGGMGVVYLAHDTKLDRKVAIKSLPAELMKHQKARSRFSREARVLASLNHPNIAAIYDELQEEKGAGFLVLEYIPGETLAERITRTPLKLKDALSIGRQIAEAVSAAHEKGVIHRDLKAGNIKMTPEGQVKVLDFGLARGVSSEEVDQGSTITELGRIIGTPAYMSPEQARGKQVDKRSDIWSFGCVLYEMLTGRLPFKGETTSDTLAGILEREPDWDALPPTTPVNIQIMLRRCLEKDRHQRLHDIADAAIEIRETLSGVLGGFALPGKVAEGSRLFRCDVILVALASFIVGMFIAGAIIMKCIGPPKAAVVSRLLVPVPADKPLYTGTAPNQFLAISPDGTRLVYVGELDNRNTELYMRSLDDTQIKPIRGTRNAHNPFFSPDGKWVGFFTEDKQLKKVSLAGGEPLTLLEDIPLGVAAFGSWADDGTIVFSVRSGSRGLERISENGGPEAETLIARIPEDDQAYYCYPQVLPGGDAILFSSVYFHVPGTSRIEAFLQETGKRQTVLNNASYATYVSSGHLIFVRDNVLMAAPFDVKQLKITGPLVPLVKDDVEFDWIRQTPQIAISDNGTIVYISGTELRKGQLVWVDRRGISTSLVTNVDVYEGPRLSPDGRLIAVGIRSRKEANIRVHVYNIQLGTFTPVMTEGESTYPLWSPDGTRIAFWGWENRTEGSGVFCTVVGAIAPAERLASKPPMVISLLPYSWSQNLLACTVLDPNTREDIWIVDLDGDQKPKPVLNTEHREYNPAFSPDGRWFAYVSDESGQSEIYLREDPNAGRRWTVPTRGATNPVWSRDGRELYYISDNRMMAVEVASEPNFPIGTPELLFEFSDDLIVSGGSLTRGYDVSDDGQFLMVKRSGDPRDQLIVVQNWFEELKQLAPPRKK